MHFGDNEVEDKKIISVNAVLHKIYFVKQTCFYFLMKLEFWLMIDAIDISLDETFGLLWHNDII